MQRYAAYVRGSLPGGGVPYPGRRRSENHVEYRAFGASSCKLEAFPLKRSQSHTTRDVQEKVCMRKLSKVLLSEKRRYRSPVSWRQYAQQHVFVCVCVRSSPHPLVIHGDKLQVVLKVAVGTMQCLPRSSSQKLDGLRLSYRFARALSYRHIDHQQAGMLSNKRTGAP